MQVVISWIPEKLWLRLSSPSISAIVCHSDYIVLRILPHYTYFNRRRTFQTWLSPEEYKTSSLVPVLKLHQFKELMA